MKKVEALIRPERLEPVMEELRKLSYPGVTITEVKGTASRVTHMWRAPSTAWSSPQAQGRRWCNRRTWAGW